MFETLSYIIFLIVIFVVGKIIFKFIKAITQQGPILSKEATIIGKRKEVDVIHRGTRISSATNYTVTFKSMTGEQLVFRVSQRDYHHLKEGMHGKLTHQGTHYKGFEFESFS